MTTVQPHTVLMTGDTVGGVWTYATDLARSLGELGIHTHLATMGRPLDRNQWLEASQIPGLIIHESTWKLEWMEDPWESVDASCSWLLDLERELSPDLIHLNTYAHGNLPWNAPVLMVGHSCVLSWWRAVKKSEAPGRLNRYRRRVKEGLQAADRVIGVSRFMLEQLSHDYGPFRHSEVIYNARHLTQEPPGHVVMASESCAENSTERPAEKKNLIFSMGRLWDEGKNVDALIHAAPALRWPVSIAGEDRGLLGKSHENVRLLGKLTPQEVFTWLRQASVFVMPSRYEPFGLSVLEAALSGCALILSDIPTFREVWGESALYIDPESPDHIHQQIKRLTNDRELCREMAVRALHRSGHYHPQQTRDQYLRHYRELLNADQPGETAGSTRVNLEPDDSVKT